LGEQKKRHGAKGKDGGSGRGGGSGKGGARLSGSNVGRVLRTAYDDALCEAVPDEFLKLLGKLD
jgi:Anti-sigma factor NepR